MKYTQVVVERTASVQINSELNRYTRLDDTQAINREYLLSRGQSFKYYTRYNRIL